MSQGSPFLARAGMLSVLVAATAIMSLRMASAATPAPEGGGARTTEAVILYVPSVDDYYPPTSKSTGESGVVGVRACYGNTGRMIAVEIQTTSNYPRLDEAALKLAKRVRVRPGTRDGRVVSGCVHLPIAFKLPEAERKA